MEMIQHLRKLVIVTVAAAASVAALAPRVTGQVSAWPKVDPNDTKEGQAVFLEEQLGKAQSALGQSESHLHRLHELQTRLAMGLDVRSDKYWMLDATQRESVSDGRGKDRVIKEQQELQRLSRIASEMQTECDRLQRGLRSRHARAGMMSGGGETAAAGRDIPIVSGLEDLPQPSVALPQPTASAPSRLLGSMSDRPLAAWNSETPRGASDRGSIVDDNGGMKEPKPRVGEMSAKPMGEGANLQIEVPGAAAHRRRPQDRSRVIVGSNDRGNVARMLLRSGEEMILRASTEVDEGLAETLRKDGVELVRSAKKEFEAFVGKDSGDATLSDLYHLARCEEKLKNIAAADSHYAEIIARDVHLDAEGTETYGRWGRAAQAAKSVLRWVSDTGSWNPDIDSIDWNNK